MDRTVPGESSGTRTHTGQDTGYLVPAAAESGLTLPEALNSGRCDCFAPGLVSAAAVDPSELLEGRELASSATLGGRGVVLVGGTRSVLV